MSALSLHIESTDSMIIVGVLTLAPSLSYGICRLAVIITQQFCLQHWVQALSFMTSVLYHELYHTVELPLKSLLDAIISVLCTAS